MSAFLEKKRSTQPTPQLLSGADAARLVISSPYESLTIVGFNATEAERLGLKQGEQINVAPEDVGRSLLSKHLRRWSAEQFILT